MLCVGRKQSLGFQVEHCCGGLASVRAQASTENRHSSPCQFGLVSIPLFRCECLLRPCKRRQMAFEKDWDRVGSCFLDQGREDSVVPTVQEKMQ